MVRLWGPDCPLSIRAPSVPLIIQIGQEQVKHKYLLRWGHAKWPSAEFWATREGHSPNIFWGKKKTHRAENTCSCCGSKVSDLGNLDARWPTCKWALCISTKWRQQQPTPGERSLPPYVNTWPWKLLWKIPSRFRLMKNKTKQNAHKKTEKHLEWDKENQASPPFPNTTYEQGSPLPCTRNASISGQPTALLGYGIHTSQGFMELLPCIRSSWTVPNTNNPAFWTNVWF